MNSIKSKTPPFAKLAANLARIRSKFPDAKLTLAEKILYTHASDIDELLNEVPHISQIRGNAYLKLSPDRVAMQDASAQTALLQFMATQMPNSAVPASIHCDHLVVGRDGAEKDLEVALKDNYEVFNFLKSCAERYGLQFWGPGSGIIHQIVLENFSAPGLLMLGTDSHTPNAGGLGALAIGVGGADAVDALTGTPWELRAPKVLGVKLTGSLKNWSAPKDVITFLAGKLGVKGGTGSIIEYFGEGTKSLSCTGMATICNMGAEVGATTSTFPFSDAMRRYLQSTNRGPISEQATAINQQSGLLTADAGCQYDQVVEINLSHLQPHVNGPFTPDLSTPIGGFKDFVEKEEVPEDCSAALIGSCTNSSYEDMSRVSDLVRQAESANLKPRVPFYVTPGSEQIRATLERDGILSLLERNNAIILANACGPCIGQWDRSHEPKTTEEGSKNAIFTSFNRNFKRRNDGNPNTLNFLTSPEIVTAMAYAGKTTFNPLTDKIPGTDFKFDAPGSGDELPLTGFTQGNRKELYPDADPQPNPNVEIQVDPLSTRLQILEPFAAWNGQELATKVAIKVQGKCTTDHISAAGPWLKYKGHLENISENTLIGGVNAETGRTNLVMDNSEEVSIPQRMKNLKSRGEEWSIVAEDNYGEGSAREHAALSPRFLGGSLVLVKSFARIHETNLKKQGILPLTFSNPKDYDRINSDDILRTIGLPELVATGKGDLQIEVTKPSGKVFTIPVKHTMSTDQLKFFKHGSAINAIRDEKLHMN